MLKDFLEEYKAAFIEQDKSKMSNNQTFCIVNGKVTYDGSESKKKTASVVSEYNFAVPSSWLCEYTASKLEEAMDWISKVGSDEIDYMFWEAIHDNVVAAFTDIGITYYKPL